MTTPGFKIRMLCSAICLASSNAFSDDTTSHGDQQYDRLEYVTVTARPVKDSQQAAFDAKQFADNAMEIISADTIGRFPDQNLADSLGRLPGLAIERDQGQARYINFRGAPFRYTAIAFDGIDVPGAENGRIPRFDSFPAIITRRIEASKAIMPNMPGEAVAGFVNVHTFSPFDQEGWSFSGDIGMGEQQLGGGDIDKFGLRAAWSNEHFGAALYSSENSREQITDNREYDLERDDNGELVVNELDFRSYKVTREDRAHGGTLEYRDDGIVQRAFVSTLYSEFVDKEQRNQFVFSFSDPVAGLSADNRDVSVNRLLENGKYENSTLSNTIGADLQLNMWHLEGRINKTETEFSMDLPIPYSLGASTTASYDMSDLENPKLYLDQDLSTLSYGMTLGLHYGQALNIDATKFKLDAERDYSWFDLDATLQIGLQSDAREAEGFVATPQMGAFPGDIDIDSYNTGRKWDSNTSNTIGGTYYNNTGLYSAWKAAGLSPVVAGPESQIAIDEDILALYAMSTTRFSWGSVVAGARLEQTDYKSTGTVEGEAVSVEDDFTHILPAVHVNIDLRDDLKLRVSGSTGVNRPTYNEWRAAASVDVQEQEVTGGNPTLEAEEAMGIDTALEWYFAPASLASVGVFYRQIDNVIYTDVSTIDGGVYVASAAGQQWIYNGAVNGKNGEMSGIEFSFTGHAIDLIGPALDGLGVSANMTLLDSEFEGLDGVTRDLPGTSDVIYNASLFYENFGLSARINYQYRDEWISPIEDPDEVWGEQKRVDFSISYDLPIDLQGAQASVYFNANNLTDETDVRYAKNGTINQSESYGRRYLMGVRLSF